jgi:hypothetical protein
MARLPLFRWTVLPRCEESQKNGQHSARAASSLLDLRRPGGDWFCGDFGWPEFVDGVGAIRFGGVPFGVMGDFPGTFARGGFFS